MPERLGEFLERLQQHDYKLTPQRRMILQVFQDHPERHLSADDVFHLVRADHPEIGLATVYRTLDLFTEVNILQRIEFGDGRARYEFADRVRHHHHLVCTDCGRVEEVHSDIMQQLAQNLHKQYGFEAVDQEIKFFGRCRHCRARK